MTQDVHTPAYTQITPFIEWLAANKISRPTGYRLWKEGLINPVKLKRRTYITLAEADRFLASLQNSRVA